jgi:hypothetical protein
MSADNQQVGGTHYKGLSDHLAQATNGRIYVDPVTGNVGIGTPAVQRTWVGLTNEEITSVANNSHPLNGVISFARAIEAKLKEKNT